MSKKNTQPSRKRRPSQGFSLIEVLVALLILSIGVVGVTGVQLSSIKFNQVSQQRSYAAQHALSITERMRSNLEGVRPPANFYIFDWPFATIPSKVPAAPAGDCTAPAAACTPQQMANKNLNQWLTQLAASLPSGRGTITQNSALVGAPYVVTVMWEEKELNLALSQSSHCPVGTPATVQCVRMEFQP